MHEQIDMRGALTLCLTDRDGNVVHEQHRRNRIVSAGRDLVARFFTGQDLGPGRKPQPITHIAVGTGATPTTDGDTALGNERTRKPIAPATFKPIIDADGTQRIEVEVSTVLDFNDANDPKAPLTEAGIFTADIGGTMYNRVVFDQPVPKTKAFQLTLRWTIVF